MAQGDPWTPTPNGAGGIVSPCPNTCDPVIGADGKVYKNECEAQRAGTNAVASAADRSVCGAQFVLGEFLKDNLLWIVGAIALALWLVGRR